MGSILGRRNACTQLVELRDGIASIAKDLSVAIDVDAHYFSK